MLNLADLDRGEKRDIHLTLYDREVAIIDEACEHYRCSRAAVIAAWAREFATLDLRGRVPDVGRQGGARSRRR